MGAAALTEGERWTREQLEVLLARRFSPAAVAAFLVASQHRAGQVRRARPALARRSCRWMAAGAAAYALPALAGVPLFRRSARAAAVWWAATWLMLDWHLGMVETEDGRPRNLGPGDAATLVRVWLVPLAADTPHPGFTAAAFASDVLDGRLARAGEPTRIGRDLEGLADSAFAAAALRGAVRRGWVTPVVGWGEIARLGAGFAYGLWIYFARARRPDPGVTRAARITTPVRAAGLAAAGAGRSRAAAALLGAGGLGSVVAVGRALARDH
ncbi:MAG TPA: CDP-alcohol phosphatidyltransferase family protein [Solirubrobacteraceae bacterium]|nr:CDP-alcohol phosphatidyltransferase family protein [Solirubrobacteraceae bacterium]